MGCPHPDYLRGQLDARQIAEWIAYDAIEPFGSPHAELLHGIQTAEMVNLWSRERCEPADFMPSYEPPEMTWQEIQRSLREWKEASRGGSR